MRIGIVCYPSFGGSGVVATELGEALARHGHEVHFISYDPPGRFSGEGDRIHFHEVSMATYPLFKYPPYLLAMASKMAETAEMQQLDLFHVHYAIPHAISACLAREITLGKGVPVVTTLHGTDITLVGRQPTFSRLVKYALAKSSGLTAVSQSLAGDTKEIFDFTGSIKVIPNFVDLDRFKPGVGTAFRAEHVKPEEKVLMHVSNFRPVKNTVQVIRAFARVAEAMPARLLMLGDGPELTHCVQEVAELQLSDRVDFLPETPQVEKVLAAADLFLLPSSQESFGLAALEAMACGVPVLAYNVGGLPEVVGLGGGKLYPVDDYEALAAGAIGLLEDEQALAELSHEARKVAQDNFRDDRVVPMYEQFYQQVLGAC